MLARFQRFNSNISCIDLYWRRIASSIMSNYGLRGRYGIYFVWLANCPRGMTATELTAACGKDKADVSRDMATLARMGYLKRDLSDKRAYRARIYLTEKGQQLADDISRKVEQAVECVSQTIDDNEREILYGVLEKIKQSMQELSESGLPENEENSASEAGA